MTGDKLTQFAKRYAEAWRSHDLERVAAFFADNGSLSVNDGPPAVGRAAIAEIAREFMQDFPDLIVTGDDVKRGLDGTKFHWTNKRPKGSKVILSPHATTNLLRRKNNPRALLLTASPSRPRGFFCGGRARSCRASSRCPLCVS